MVPCIDPDTSKYRKKMYELFVKKKWSFYKIAQFFNRARINDWAGWVDTGIRSTLENSDAIGVFIFNRTFLDKDYETKEWERKPNPKLSLPLTRCLCAAPRKPRRTRIFRNFPSRLDIKLYSLSISSQFGS